MRILITGASGSGTSTLGAALAQTLQGRHLDGDDCYWLPTTPAFMSKRPAHERADMVCRALQAPGDVVMSGSVVGWGHDIEDAFDLIVFLTLPTALRVERLRLREIERFGHADPAFLAWAAQYEEGPPEGRSLAKHLAWLALRTCPVLSLEGDLSVAERLARVLLWVNARALSQGEGYGLTGQASMSDDPQSSSR